MNQSLFAPDASHQNLDFQKKPEAKHSVKLGTRSVTGIRFAPPAFNDKPKAMVAVKVQEVYAEEAKQKQIRKPVSVKANLPEQNWQARDKAAEMLNRFERA